MSKSSRSVLVFLHGSGGNGHDIRAFVDNVPLKEFNNNTFSEVCNAFSMDIVTPTSDVRRYTAMEGERINIWFDRTSKFFTRDGLDDQEDLEGVDRSLEKILKIVADVEDNYDHIFIGGHSMGGGLALHLLRKNVSPKFRGIFCISSCLLNMSAVFVGPPLGSAGKQPVLMMHGKRDTMVSCDWAQKTASTLLLKDVDVQFRSYHHAGHDMEEEQLVDLVHWLKDILHTHRLKIDSSVSKSAELSSPMDDSDSKGGADGMRGGAGDKHIDTAKESKAGDSDSIQAVEKLMQKQTLGSSSGAKSSGESASSSRVTTGSGGGGDSPCSIPFTVERVVGEEPISRYASPKFIIRYAVPSQYVATMTARPVLACGSMFEILSDSPNGVKTTLTSSDPQKTAVEIGRRLQIRATSGSGTLNPCNMS